MRFLIRTLLLVSMAVAPAYAAESVTGPVINNFGPVFAVPDGSFNLDADQEYKIIMDIGKGPEDPAALNRGIESAARFLNLHARNGIKAEQLNIAVVLHGSAGRAALTDKAHTEHFGVSNGSRALLEELSRAGASIYICGQTAAYRGFEVDQLMPQVTMALSAMTVHVRLQQEGYEAILF